MDDDRDAPDFDSDAQRQTQRIRRLERRLDRLADRIALLETKMRQLELYLRG